MLNSSDLYLFASQPSGAWLKNPMVLLTIEKA